jgi:hypothetical protein
LVRGYRTLSFYYHRNKKSAGVGNCSICSKPTPSSELFKCYEGGCQSCSHYYCILRAEWCKANEEVDYWVEDMKVLESSHVDFLACVRAKV